MSNRSQQVDAFLAALDHARKDEIEAVRALILGASAEVGERVKWNAPSFCVGGDDRVTLRLQPGDRLQLVFHRGAKRKDATGFVFDDPSGLLEWAAPDRGVLTIRDREDLAAKRDAIQALVAAWIEATAERG
jgi:hypothetical protein